jgi:hypothetical protein
MKNRILLLVFIAFSASFSKVNAQPEWRPKHSGILRVRLTDNFPITLALDGRYFEKHGSHLTIGDLPPGRHQLKIYTYSLRRDGTAKAHLVFEGRIKVFANDATNLVYDQVSGDMHIFAGPDNYENEPQDNVMNHRRMEPDGANTQAELTPEEHAPALQPKTDTMEKVVPADLSKPKFPALSKDGINKAGIKINALVTDTDKLKLMQSEMAKKAFTTAQLQVMLTWLSFESSRVEFAKWAFDHTLDKEKFSKIADQLKYQDSKEELLQFLKSRK